MSKKNVIIAFSSDEFFVDIYKELKKNDILVKILITETAKPSGRGLKITSNPAYNFAFENFLKIYTPEKFDNGFIAKLTGEVSKLKEDFNVIGLVFAYGKIIPQIIIDLFNDKIINIHPSLLEKYRGPSPIQQAILNGDKTTGYSIIKISKKMDAGDIIDSKKIEINSNDNCKSLRKKILNKALGNLPDIIDNFSKGKVKYIKQSEKKATYSKIIKKSDAQITLKDNFKTAFGKIRAYHLWPKAFFIILDKRFIIHDAKIKDDKLVILKIQIENKKIISAKEFSNGYKNLLTYFPKYVKFTP
jgi:methionyl-tRNA formyltransferase